MPQEIEITIPAAEDLRLLSKNNVHLGRLLLKKLLRTNSSQVWGIGKRNHADIYKEVDKRIRLLGENPEANTLAQILLKLHSNAKPILEWTDIPKEILEALIYDMGLSFETIMTLSVGESISLYERYLKNT